MYSFFDFIFHIKAKLAKPRIATAIKVCIWSCYAISFFVVYYNVNSNSSYTAPAGAYYIGDMKFETQDELSEYYASSEEAIADMYGDGDEDASKIQKEYEQEPEAEWRYYDKDKGELYTRNRASEVGWQWGLYFLSGLMLLIICNRKISHFTIWLAGGSAATIAFVSMSIDPSLADIYNGYWMIAFYALLIITLVAVFRQIRQGMNEDRIIKEYIFELTGIETADLVSIAREARNSLKQVR